MNCCHAEFADSNLCFQKALTQIISRVDLVEVSGGGDSSAVVLVQTGVVFTPTQVTVVLIVAHLCAVAWF